MSFWMGWRESWRIKWLLILLVNSINWGEVEQSVDRSIAGSPVPFDPATISNLRDLLGVIRTQCPIPEAAGKGYWSRICISWKGVEVEIFDDGRSWRTPVGRRIEAEAARLGSTRLRWLRYLGDLCYESFFG